MIFPRATEEAQREVYRAAGEIAQIIRASKKRRVTEHLTGVLVPADWGSVPDDFLTVTDEPDSHLPAMFPYITSALREAVDWEALEAAHGFRCLYCGELCSELTIDHVKPRAAGGSHAPENLAPACRSCNSSKGARPLAVWLARRPDLSRPAIVDRWERAGRGAFLA